MLDRYYTKDELRREIKRALRPDNIEDMSKEQREDYYRELELAEWMRRQNRNTIIFMFICFAAIFLIIEFSFG
ncbi:MAG: hypothetical protein Q4G54_05850 [Pelistega sp.]|nr:hypothetical protein [Pelistega sp.]